MITIVNLIPCSTISFFSLLMSMKGATLRRVAGMYAVLVAAFSFRMNADLCKSGYRGAFQWVKVASGLPVFFVLAAVSLPVPPLKADALTLPNRFFLSSLDLCGFRHTCACELASITRYMPLLISSFISARGLPGKGCSAARMGAEGVGTCLVTRPFCAKLAVQAFCSSPPGEFPCHPHSPRLAPIPLLSARYPVKGSLRRFAPLTAQAFAAPGRCDGGSGE